MPSKDFGPIESDYAFFMEHATEAESDASLFALELAPLVRRGEPIRLLDFGCGTGDFTDRLLAKLACPIESFELTLVEPVATQIAVAAQRLARYSAYPIRTLARLEDGSAGEFDVVLANHVLYYVDDLEQTLRNLLSLVAPAGKLLVAMAPWGNALMHFWEFGFGLLSEPVPYYAADDLEACLTVLGASYRKTCAPYELRFPDSSENRLKILRFMFAENLARIPSQPLLADFDRYVVRGNIEVQTFSEHFVISR